MAEAFGILKKKSKRVGVCRIATRGKTSGTHNDKNRDIHGREECGGRLSGFENVLGRENLPFPSFTKRTRTQWTLVGPHRHC